MVAVTLSILLVLSVVVGPVGASLESATSAAELDSEAGGEFTATDGTIPWPSLDGGDWPTAGRDPGRTGYNPNASGPKSAPNARWRFEFTDDVSTVPAVAADGLVFVAGDDTLRAVDNDTGDVVWNESGVEFDVLSVANGTVVAGDSSSDGGVYVYDASNGNEVWNETDYVPEATVVLDGTLYVSRETYTGQQLVAFDLQSGTHQWSSEYDGDSLAGGLSASGDTVYLTGELSTRDYALQALNASDGSERWRFEMEGVVTMTPTAANGSVFVGAGDTTYDPTFYRLNSTDGHVEWAYDSNARPQGAAVANGSVYLVGGNTIRSLDETTGEREWRYRLPGNLDYGLVYADIDALAPTVADGVVYVANDRGNLVALDADTGSERWEYELHGQTTQPALADDRIYVLAYDTRTYNYDVSRVYALEESPFQFTGFAPSTTSLDPGEQFTVDVSVENVGEETRDYNLSLMADSPTPADWWAVDEANGTLAPGQNTTVTFTAQFNSTGPWNVSVKRPLEWDAATDPVTVTVSHPTPSDDWSHRDFDAGRTSSNTNTTGPTEHVQEVWNLTHFDEYVEPVIANGSVYVAQENGTNVEHVRAYDEATGAFEWEFNVSERDRRIAGSSTVSNGTVYLYTTPTNEFTSGPTVYDASVFALDATDGSVQWVRNTTMNYSSSKDQAPVVDEGVVYVAGARLDETGDENATVLAIDADTGTPQWSYDVTEDGSTEVFNWVAVENGTVVASLSDEVDNTGQVEDELVGIDSSGSQTWIRTDFEFEMNYPPVVRDGLVYVVAENQSDGDSIEEVRVLNLSDGGDHLTFRPTDVAPSDGGWDLTKPVVTDDALYVHQMTDGSLDSNTNELYRVNATGDIVWNRTVPDLASVLAVDGVLYAANLDGKSTYVYDAETGAYYGDTDITERGHGAAQVVANGTMITYADSTTPNDFRVIREGGIVKYTDLSVDSNTHLVDDNVTVTATVTNVGAYARAYDVNLLVAPDDGNSQHYFWNYSSRDGELDPGESKTLTWTVEVRERGDVTFVLRRGDDGDSLNRHMYIDTGGVTVNVGDAEDGTLVSLGERRTVSATAGSWPKESFDAGNTGASPETDAPTEVGSNAVNWSVNHSYEWTSGPTVANETVFVGGSDDSVPESIFAYDAADGTLRWRYSTVESNDIEVPPTYASGYLYTADDDGRVYQLNATTGERLWTYTGIDDVGGITVVNDTVYVAGSGYADSEYFGTVHALNATTREVRWTFTNASESSGMEMKPAVENGTVYVTNDEDATYALDADTGDELWSQPIAGLRLHSPVVKDDVVYVDDGTNVYALDATDGGSTIWSTAVSVSGYTGSSPVLANDTLYFVGDGSVHALNTSSGDARWQTSICTAIDYSPAYAGGVVYVPADDSSIYAYDADSGELVWRYSADDYESFTPALAGGVLYTTGLENADYTHSLTALDGGTKNESPSHVDFSALTLSDSTVATDETFALSATADNEADATCGYTADFAVDGTVIDNATGTLGYNDDEQVTFTHSFSTEGTYNVTIEDLPPLEVTVTGASPEISVAPTSYNHGVVNKSQNNYGTVFISNDGQAPLNWTGTGFSGQNASEFKLSTAPNSTIQPGDTETVSFYVDVYVVDEGPKSTTLEIYSNDTSNPTVSVPLSATVDEPDGNASVAPTSHDFGTVDIGETTTHNVTVTNDGEAALTFDGATVSGSSAFDVTAGNETTALAVGESHDFTVSFSPTVEDSVSATLEVLSDDPDDHPVNVSVSGAGAHPPAPDISVEPRYLDFGNVSHGSSGTAIVTISNDGDVDLSITGETFEVFSPTFTITDGGGPTVVAPGEHHNVTLRFTPPSTGDHTTTMYLTSNDSDEPTVSVELDGTGVVPPSNRGPVPAADHYAVASGENLTVDSPGLLANDIDPNGDSFSLTHYGEPQNGTLTVVSDGSFVYEPDDGFAGTDNFVYRTRDEYGDYSSYVTVTVEVLPDPNREPTAVPDNFTVYEGETLTVSGPGVLENDRDADGDSFDATHHSNPTDGTLSTFAQDGSFVYAPDSGFTGTDTFTYRLQDEHGEYSDFETVTIEVVPDPNRDPTAVADTYSVFEGETLSVNGPGVLANDFDLDDDSFDASHHGNPDHGTLSTFVQDGSFVYEPDNGFTGTDTFSYRVQDEHGEYSGFETVTIHVAPNNTAPTAVADTYSTRKGENLTVSGPGVLANDYDVDGDSFDAPHHGNPSNGTLSTFVQDGSFVYVPDPGFTGTDTFSYRLEDDHGEYSGYETVTIEVVDTAETAPVALSDTYTVYEDETLSVSGPGVLANDIDPNNDSFDATHHGNPSNGTLSTFVQDGSFVYTPNPGFTGADTFSYRVQDENGEYSGYATVTVEVLPDPNDEPTAVADTYTVYEGETLTIDGPGVLANDYDLDNDSFDAPHHSNPSNGDLSVFYGSGGFEYTPDPGFTGVDTFSYHIEDEHGEYSDYETVTIEVVPDPNRDPTAVADTYSVFEGETLTVNGSGVLANDYDLDDDSFNAPHHGNPSNGDLSVFYSSGGFKYTPEAGFTGTDSFVYHVEDEHGEYSGYETVSIEVLPEPNREPTAVPDNYVVLQGESLTVNGPGVLANDYDLDNDSFDAPHHGNPSNGDLSVFYGNGGFEYTPDPGFTGVDSFSYHVQDEHGEYSGYETVTITVVDAVTSGSAEVAVTPEDIDFGTVAVGTNDTRTVTVANIGDENLSVSGVSLSGANASDFEITAGNNSSVLGYGATQTVEIEYAPTDLGTSTATLTIHTNDTDESTVNVTLLGESDDDTAPTIDAVTLDGNHENGSVVYTNDTVDVEVDVSDEHGSVDSVSVTLDSQFSTYDEQKTASYDSSSGNWTVTFGTADVADEGRYDVVVEAEDDRGNERTTTATGHVVFDWTAPEIPMTVARINASAANVSVNTSETVRPGSLEVDVERPDGSNVTVTLRETTDGWNGTFALPEDGQYNLSATATDLAGNRGSDDATGRFTTASTDGNDTITVQMQPSGLFVRFTTNQTVNNTFVTMTERRASAVPLVRGQAGVNFLNAALGKRLSENLSYAIVGIPVDTSLLKPGTDVDDVTIKHFNESTKEWEKVPTTVQNETLNGTTGRYWVANVSHFSTYGAIATDTAAPTIESVSPADGTELADGTTSKTLRVEYNDSFTGVDVSRTSVLFDDSLVTTADATTITSDYVEFEADGLADGSSHTFEVTVEDEAGNSHTETLSFSVDSPPNPPSDDDDDGGSPSGGDGGDDGDNDSSSSDGDSSPSLGGDDIEQPPEPSPSLSVTALGDGGFLLRTDNVTHGDSLSATIEDGTLGTTGVSIESLTLDFADGGDRTIRVSGRPTANAPELGSEQGAPLAFVTFDDADTVESTVRFSVSRTTLADRGVESSDVVVYSLVGGEWSELDVARIDSTADVLVYEVTAESATMLVVGTRSQQQTSEATTDQPAETTTAESTPTATQSTTETTTSTGTPGFGFGVSLAALVAVLCLLGRRGRFGGE
ncbi:Ig-like domain-containing protein [Haloferax namakaokahaiae]|uniref:Ig-like domain-containing protein n=1 Tax=Haloferax namakaokahaiae TaxID=1748331 RepID=A0ABD5ZD37_9EURY